MRFAFWGGLAMLLLQPALLVGQDRLSPADAVAKARQALGHEAFKQKSKDVLIEGQTEYLGMPGKFRLRISPEGKVLQTIDAHGIHQVGFDGKTVWARDFSRRARVPDFDDHEWQGTILSVLSQQWLSPVSPFALTELPGASDQKLALYQLSRTGDVEPARLGLDRGTWQPVRLARNSLFGEVVWDFSDYADYSGVKFPRQWVFSRKGGQDRYEIKQVTFVASDNPAGYSFPIEQPDVTWDKAVPSRIEVSKVHWHLYVKPKVNGKDVGWFAFDTGTGGGMTISQKAAEALGLPAFGKTQAGGAGKLSPARFRQAESFQLGPVTMKSPVMMEMPEAFTEAMSRQLGMEMAGTVGYDFIANTVAELDLAQVTIDLFPPDEYQLKKGAWQPLRFNRRIPCTECTIEGKTKGWFQFDTGAGNLLVVHGPTVRQEKLLDNRKTQPQPLMGVGGTIEAQFGQVVKFTVGEHTATNVSTFFVTGKEGALTDGHTGGTFGAYIFGGGKVVFDYSHRRMAIVKE